MTGGPFRASDFSENHPILPMRTDELISIKDVAQITNDKIREMARCEVVEIGPSRVEVAHELRAAHIGSRCSACGKKLILIAVVE